MLIENSRTSKDLRNVCPLVADALLEELVPEFCSTNPPCPNMATNQSMAPLAHTMQHIRARKEMKNLTVKATYREDIIRFRISLDLCNLDMKEVATRLKLEVGTFKIKYLDDDHEWVLIACDADLQEWIFQDFRAII